MTSPIAVPGARWDAKWLRLHAQLLRVNQEDVLGDCMDAHANAIEALQRGAAPEEVLRILTGDEHAKS